MTIAGRAPVVLCMERWTRQPPWLSAPITFTCQYPKDHPAENGHSWSALKAQDEQAIAAMQQQPDDDEPPHPARLATLLAGIDKGDYDPYIESILAVAHERKRALRGARTFPLRND